ncbi:PilZ domain-containing protein [Sphingomonas baiyangensis]|nr:PilZ domain-containing protein [Sphingomonas baiyangensis]
MAARATQFRPVAAAHHDRRVEPRHRVALSGATVRRHGDQSAVAELLDLSIYGCRLATDAPHLAGERIWLRFEGGMPVAATIVWHENARIGCRFDAPIARALVRTLTLHL